MWEGDHPVCTTIGRKIGDTTPVRPLGLGLDGREPAGSINRKELAAQPPRSPFAQRIVTRMGRDRSAGSGRSLEPGSAKPDAHVEKVLLADNEFGQQPNAMRRTFCDFGLYGDEIDLSRPLFKCVFSND